jgi:hypothetical protein
VTATRTAYGLHPGASRDTTLIPGDIDTGPHPMIGSEWALMGMELVLTDSGTLDSREVRVGAWLEHLLRIGESTLQIWDKNGITMALGSVYPT